MGLLLPQDLLELGFFVGRLLVDGCGLRDDGERDLFAAFFFLVGGGRGLGRGRLVDGLLGPLVLDLLVEGIEQILRVSCHFYYICCRNIITMI